MSYSCIVYIYAVYSLLDHALCTLYDSPEYRLAAPTTQPTTMTTRSTSAMKTTCTGRSPNPYTEENQRLWASDEDSGDSDFDGFDDVDDARCG